MTSTTPATNLDGGVPPVALNGVDLQTVASLVDTVRATPRVASTTWRAEVSWDGGFRSTARIRGFDPLVSDEPTTLGGGDSAPNPVEQLLAALGNCLAVGYAANATADGISIRALRVELAGELDLGAFLGLRPGHAGFDTIRATVHLDTDATPEQAAQLHDAVVGSSPVGHTLQAAIPVSITLADAGAHINPGQLDVAI
jgi:uncharacterized OsmC-like protein